LLAESRAVVDEFLRQVPMRSGLEHDRILFVLDAIRPQVYSPDELAASGNSYFALMRTYFADRARASGFEVIDLTGPFAEAYETNGRKFEFETDNHWNAEGHAIVAGQISESRMFREAFH
jgi:hypothetical protein